IVEVYSIDDSLASQKSDFYNLKQEIKKQLELIGKQTLEPCKQRKTLFMLYDR
ncbi:MAG: family 3 adenylate cyclase, partial [Pseudanabaena sp. M007S1SP1A06QC]|nr:family 3 adenylate cyclase [Pseudanabaena sp. M007S1SP1A06QC]